MHTIGKLREHGRVNRVGLGELADARANDFSPAVL